MNQLFKYIFIAGLISIPVFMHAQTKPKRDKSKDRSVIVAKQREQTKQKKATEAAERERRQVAEAQRRRKVQVSQAPKYASYLRVNQLTSVTKTVGPNRGSETFIVTTDGKDWSISNLPSWCKVSKYSTNFVLSYDRNDFHQNRSGWFVVKSDNQEVKIYIYQDAQPVYITSRFNYASLTHNAYSYESNLYGIPCLRINANVTIAGAKGLNCAVVAFIEDEFGNNIKATSQYSKYGNTSNDVFSVAHISPTTDDAQTYNVSIFLPNDAMRLWKKKKKLTCRLGVYCYDTSKFVNNASYTLKFKAKNKKGKVTTKKL